MSGTLVAMSLVSRAPGRIHNKNSNFSIEHILNVAGGKPNFSYQEHTPEESKQFDWLNCTRYRPPKLPRQRKKEGVQRRSLGRNPRIPFSSSQVAFLEAKFLRTPYLSSHDVTQLASYLKLSEIKVKIWFQNRRAREKREKESKSKAKEKSEKDFTSIPPPPQPTVILPVPPPPQSIPLTTTTTCKYVTCSTSCAYLQILTPLDLSERRLTCRPE